MLCRKERKDAKELRPTPFGVNRRFLTALFVSFCFFRPTLPASAHNPDTSYARIVIGTNEVAFRFTYDVFTLLKIAPLDANNDRQVTRRAARPRK